MEKWKYFESQNEHEKVSLLIRQHWFVLAIPTILAGLTYLITVLAVTVLPFIMPNVTKGFSYNIYILIISFFMIAATTAVYSAVLLYYLNVVIITDEHLVQINQKRFFYRHIAQTEIIKIQDVSSRQTGLIASVLNFGTVDVQTAGELPNFQFVNIPNPSEVAKQIMEIKLKYTRKHHSHPANVGKQPEESVETPDNLSDNIGSNKLTT